MRWKEFVRTYFMLMTGERNGMLLVAAIIFICILTPFGWHHFYHRMPADFSHFKMQIDSLNTNQQIVASEFDSTKYSSTDLYQSNVVVETKPAELFSFDPNTATEGDWKKFGVNEKTIHTIMNYKSKGGKFYKKEDLKKIYGLKAEDYTRLEPYIQIAPRTPETFQNEKHTPYAVTDSSSSFKEIGSHSSERKSFVIELNGADSSQLVSINGIGAVLSSRIVKFRDKLGGFYSADQLKEVFGLRPETFDLIKDHISVDPSAIKKININFISIDELKQHPYFKYPVANMVINYRAQHGAFKSVNDLKNIEAITDDVFQKILPYVVLQD